MSECIECDGSCSCHINPPCSYCTDHIECEECGDLVCNDFTDEGLCLACDLQKEGVAE